MNAPAEAFRFQALAKEIAAELRAKFDRIRDRSQHKDRQGAWPRCAGIDPAERGRIDRIGIPQRKRPDRRRRQWVRLWTFGDVGSMSGYLRKRTLVCAVEMSVECQHRTSVNSGLSWPSDSEYFPHRRLRECGGRGPVNLGVIPSLFGRVTGNNSRMYAASILQNASA